jgi:hypothetical protein
MNATTSVLDPQRHARLIADMEHVCAVANVPKSFVQTSMKTYCSAEVIDWVVNFRLYRPIHAGLLLVNASNPDTQCLAIGGALIRNFIDARVIPLNTLLMDIESSVVPSPTVLIVPNLYVSQLGKALPAWKIQQVYDLLLRRMTQNLPTVVSVENMLGMEQTYGRSFAQHLNSHYKVA